ncbi:MAG: DUF1318 domain-containing protein [Chthoniobacterales bacterium]|nr:DUF1318 domain-containing protein [Chthoniobacterales bacterium]
MKWSAAAIPVLLLAAACKGPNVSLSTPEPIVVDINMRVDIYERGGGSSSAKPSPAADMPAADARRRSRTGDIQTFKNSRLVGEGRDGLLSVLSRPEGSYGAYVEKTVAEENADRLVVMRELAAERKMSLPEVQAQQGELWRNRSFSGEWVEVLQDNNSWRWAQKQ